MTDLATFCGTYSDWKLIRTRSVVQIIFEVPLEASGDAYRVLGGMPQPSKEVWCAVARLQNGKEANAPTVAPKPASEDPPVRAPRKPVAPENRLTRISAILCADPVFQSFLFEHDMIDVRSEEKAKLAVYFICHVDSRSKIIPGTPAGEEWEKLYSKFMAWKIAA